MTPWLLALNIILVLIGLVAVIGGIVLVVLFCQSCGLVEQKPWEE